MDNRGGSVLESIVEGVRADLAVREAEVDFDEIKRRAARRAAADGRAGRAAGSGHRGDRRGQAVQPVQG